MTLMMLLEKNPRIPFQLKIIIPSKGIILFYLLIIKSLNAGNMVLVTGIPIATDIKSLDIYFAQVFKLKHQFDNSYSMVK